MKKNESTQILDHVQWDVYSFAYKNDPSAKVKQDVFWPVWQNVVAGVHFHRILFHD